ncbi:MAG: 3'-5' exonuclease domain-containing protein 2 [SAR324 cluster bacterium]|nr:3'-5' exonuclease domain-containing protein 2 [SAR324 cluster bacterium]
MQHSFPVHITKEEINDFPQVQFEGKIHLIDSPEKLPDALKRLSKETVLGFDTETRPSFKKGTRYSVSLLQLSTSDEVFLFRLNLIHLPAKLKKILEDKDVVKLGVAVHDDIKALQELSSFEANGFADFAHISKKMELKNSGLRSLAGIFLGVRISKSARLSNWESKELTETQMIYAATDAWVCLKMYIKLLNSGLLKNFLLTPIAPSPRKKKQERKRQTP